jgi:hypothetical protein
MQREQDRLDAATAEADAAEKRLEAQNVGNPAAPTSPDAAASDGSSVSDGSATSPVEVVPPAENGEAASGGTS